MMPPPNATRPLPAPMSIAMSHHPSPSKQSLRFYRLVTLLSLMLSDGTYTVLRRYSRGILHETYSVNEVLLMAEIIKLSFSTYVISRKRRKHHSSDGQYSSAQRLSTHLFNLLLKSRKMLVLAVTYGLGNLLSYYALARVGAGTFVVIANLKTLTTAGFSCLILGRSYSWTRWRALILLVAGVVLFILPTLENAKGGSDGGLVDDEVSASETIASTSGMSGIIMGCLAELIVITLSGFASIYFEKAIKNDPLDIWERNFQLGFYSIFMYCFLIAIYPTEADGGYLFANWTPLAVALSCLGAAGGLLVALSIKYGDSVLKTLAISGSIIYSSVVDHAVLGGPLTGQMCISAVVVIIAVVNYTFDSTPAEDKSSNVVVSPNNNIDKPMQSTDARSEEDGWVENEEKQPMIDAGQRA